MENHQLSSDNPMILEIRELLEKSRKNIAQQVNTELLTTYWNIGRIIVEYEQQKPASRRVWKADLKRTFQRTDKGVWKRLFALQSSKYEGVLSGL